ncbi:pirin family protein [Roseiconus nitratireducens]|uniref:Pirin family protein n=1 Tax=Roseiconus nitratireducens TaxID=2605748 RepID=A0A5M6CV61_9BACT|nr:pirin family protein [Roseiconus nitratireducens]KAA5539081.1 pirin family protein [Roseiconus nitratireducens]
MNTSRRKRLSLTDDGLIHVADNASAERSETQEPAPNAEPSPDRGPASDPGLLVRQAAQRGHTDLGWLKSFHSFSFGGYYDQQHMGFRSLRVINDDRIAAGRGFPTHPHHDMEIISYVLDGSLQHRDSTGHGSVITPDDIQMMSAGTGITHSEYNPSSTDGNHFLQIWIQPSLRGVRPRYSENKVTADQKRGHWFRIAGPDRDTAAVSIHQDANIFATKLAAGETTDYVVQPGRHAWLQVARGELTVNGTRLTAGDAVATSRPTALHVQATQPTDALLFDLA